MGAQDSPWVRRLPACCHGERAYWPRTHGGIVSRRPTHATRRSVDGWRKTTPTDRRRGNPASRSRLLGLALDESDGHLLSDHRRSRFRGRGLYAHSRNNWMSDTEQSIESVAPWLYSPYSPSGAGQPQPRNGPPNLHGRRPQNAFPPE